MASWSALTDPAEVPVTNLADASVVGPAALEDVCGVAVTELGIQGGVGSPGLPYGTRHIVPGLHSAAHVVLAVLRDGGGPTVPDLRSRIHAGHTARHRRGGEKG